MTAEIVNIVRFFLPDPKKLIDAGFPVCVTQRHDRELFLQVISVYNAEELNGMRRGFVFPSGAYVAIGIPYAFR
jgi:hypothetical protein